MGGRLLLFSTLHMALDAGFGVVVVILLLLRPRPAKSKVGSEDQAPWRT